MPVKSQQETLMFPVRKTRSSRLTNVKNMTKNELSQISTQRKTYLGDPKNSAKRFGKTSNKTLPVSNEENTLDLPVNKESLKMERNILNVLVPVVHLHRDPLTERYMQENFSEMSPKKLEYNITPKKNRISSSFKCDISPKCDNISSPLKSHISIIVDSPRRSPRKLNFENSPSRIISKLSFSSPKKSMNVIGLHSVQLTVYQALKASLTQSCDTHMVGREKEANFLKKFLESHLQASRPGSLYVSGAPGTGKTALITRTMKCYDDLPFKQININCMSHKSSKDIFGGIADGLNLSYNRSEREMVHMIENSLTKSKIPIVIVLDEVDQLESRDQTVLYTLFEWPALENSKLILIGIANMLDLTDRILPRLQSVKACKPQLLHFAPYTKAEIINIINERIKESGISDSFQVIKPSAIQFLAGKVAAVAGDVRKALDVCRRAVELCEIQSRKQLRLVSHRSPSKSPRKTTNQIIKQIDIPQVLSIFNEIYGNRITTAITENSDNLPLQQKVLLCSLLLMLKHSKTKNVILGKFHEVYIRVCSRQKLPSVEQSEFFSLCTLLEARGMLQVKKTKEIRNSKILLRLDENETADVLGDKDLLANVLDDRLSLKPNSN